MKLVTFSRKDPICEQHLLGTFSKSERALPIQSLNVNTQSEQITFRVLPLTEIKMPWFPIRWGLMLKAHHLALVTFPVFAILMKNLVDESLRTPAVFASSALAALCLMTAVNFRNDSVDHLKGLDRVHPSSGSRALQKGWVTAQYLTSLSFVFLALGVLFGIPAILAHPEVLFLIAGLAGLGLIGMTSFKVGLKYRRWSELTVFLLLGPMLTIGLQMSTGAPFDLECVLLGCVTGWFAVFVLHLQNFQLLMVNDQAGFQNTMTWLGFEHGKKFLALGWAGFLGLFLLYHFLFADVRAFLFYGLISVPAMVLALIQLKRLKTILGSQMMNVGLLFRGLGFFYLGLWSLEWVWYLWVL